MTATTQFKYILGKWKGTNDLWLSPEEEARESKTTALVATVAQGQFITISYTWDYEGKPQDGLIVFPSGITQDNKSSVWLDSWHMRNDIMICDVVSGENGKISLKGSYSAPPDPDWGWRIEIESHGNASLVIRMINISPEGQEALAVLAQYEHNIVAG